MSDRPHPTLLLTLFLVCLGAGSVGADAPRGVSPGDTARGAEIEDGCPTFSWSAVDGADQYELAVYRVAEDGRGIEPVFRQRFEGPASGWTPPLDRCLEAGQSYAWSVRAMEGTNLRDWSTPLFFRVAETRPPPTLEEALEVVRAYYDALRPESATLPEAALTTALAALSGRSGSDAIPGLPAVGEVEVSVAGGVEASSFSGDGSSLTGLDPSEIVPGIANISIEGSSVGLNCFGCVSWPHFAPGEITGGQIQDRQVTGSDIDTSTVQARIGSCGDDSVIQSIDSSGSVTCTSNTQVLSGQEYSVESSGGIEFVSAPSSNRHCFLSQVGFRETWVQTAACKIELSQYGESWVLFASSQGSSLAKCRMRCIEIVPNRTN